MRVAVVGAAGRMGTAVCAAVAGADDLELVAAVDPAHAGERVAGVEVSASLTAAGAPEVAVDFTSPSAVVGGIRRCAELGLHVVVGTTGLGAPELVQVADWYPDHGSLGCIVAPNFAIGAVLMMHFAEMAAPWFESAEIVELHHDAKVDAPSGTALRTAERMAAASGDWSDDPTTDTRLDGARGGLGPAGIRIHSVRLRGLVAHQEVLLGSTGELLTLRHDAVDRSAFVPGVLAAVRAVAGLPGLTVGLESVLGLPGAPTP